MENVEQKTSCAESSSSHSVTTVPTDPSSSSAPSSSPSHSPPLLDENDVLSLLPHPSTESPSSTCGDNVIRSANPPTPPNVRPHRAVRMSDRVHLNERSSHAEADVSLTSIDIEGDLPSSITADSVASTPPLSPSSSICVRFVSNGRYHFAAIAKSKAKRILLLSCFFSVCFVIASMVYLSISLNNVKANYQYVINTDEVKVTALQLQLDLSLAESAVRGYILTEDNDTFLAQSDLYIGEAENSLFPSLESLTSSNDEEHFYMDQLKPLFQKRIRQLEALSRQRIFNGTINSTLVQNGAATQSAMYALLDNVINVENSFLMEQQNAANNSVTQMTVVMFVCLITCGISILVGVAIGFDWDTKQLQLNNRRLEVLLKKAEDATKMKSEFISNISHELRTPFNGILAMSHLLAATNLNDEQSDIIDTVIYSAESMMRLINDLLLFSKIEAGKFDIQAEPFPIEPFVRLIADISAVRAQNKGIDFITQLDPSIPSFLFSDSGRLRQVLVNLVDNAIKFTSKGSVTLSIKLVTLKNQKKEKDGRILKEKSKEKDSKSSVRDKGNSTHSTPTMVRPSPPVQTHSMELRRIVLKNSVKLPNRNLTSERKEEDVKVMKSTNSPDGTPSIVKETLVQIVIDKRQSGYTPPTTRLPSPPIGTSESTPQQLSQSKFTPLSRNTSLGGGTPQTPNNTIPSHFILFQVIDTGIGIPVEAQQRIFEPFAQADSSTTRKFGGTGLGLSISRQLVHLLGGKLKVKSKAGYGSVFSFALPLPPIVFEKAEMAAQIHVENQKTDHIDADKPTDEIDESEHKNPSNANVNFSKVRPSTFPSAKLTEPSSTENSDIIRQNVGVDLTPSPFVRTHRLGEKSVGVSNDPHLPNRSVGKVTPPPSNNHSRSHSSSTHFAGIVWHEEKEKEMEGDWDVESISSSVRSSPSTRRTGLQLKATIVKSTFASIQPTLSDLIKPTIQTNNGESSFPSTPDIAKSPITARAAKISNFLSSLANEGRNVRTTEIPPNSSYQSTLNSSSSVATEVVSMSSTSSLSSSQSNTADFSFGGMETLASLTTSLSTLSQSSASAVNSEEFSSSRSSSIQPSTRTHSRYRPKATYPSSMSVKTPLRILVAEDNFVNQKVFRRLLERDGHHVTIVDNGESAVKAFTTTPFEFDCILMDWHMPIIDGLTATAIIRQTERKSEEKYKWGGKGKGKRGNQTEVDSPSTEGEVLSSSSSFFSVPSDAFRRTRTSLFHIPIIAVTASAMDEDRDQCLRAGVDDIITKPIDAHLLTLKLIELAEEKNKTEEPSQQC